MMNSSHSPMQLGTLPMYRISMMFVTGVILLACGVSTPSQPSNAPAPQGVDSQPTSFIPVEIATDTPIPSVPPTTIPTDVPPLPPAAATTGCPSAFSCSDSGLPPLVIAAGGPNDPTFTPCEFPRPQAWVDSPIPYALELGENHYFFACDFPIAPVSAAVTLSDGSVQSISLLDSIPNPDLRMGNAMAVVDWTALPTQPVGFYTITITSADGTQAQMQFQVNSSTTEHILTVPSVGPPGTAFNVYYVNFDLNTSPTFIFYGENQPTFGDHTLLQLGSWQITIDQPLAALPGKGWALQSLPSATTDPPGTYSITYDFKRIFNLFWIR